MNRVCFWFAIFVQYFIRWSSFSADAKVCSLNVDNELVKTNQALMISSDGKHNSLLLPEKNEKDSVINLTGNNQVILICPGEDNELSTIHKDTVITTCKQDELQTQTGGQIIKGTDRFFCKKQITPEIISTGKKCGRNLQSKIFVIGYSAKSLNDWFPMLEICHDIVNMNTLYSINIIQGKSIDARQKNVPRPPEFMEGNLKQLYNGDSPNKFYFKKSQVRLFQNLLKTQNVDKYVDLENKYLSRGHLTPDADMSLSSWKVATYMYINVAPQWQMINAGNWLKVENKVRNAAIWSQGDFEIITGTYGVMKLHHNKAVKEIYLAPGNKLPVPEQFWKVIYHLDTQSAIVIVTSNNPYEKVQFLCKDICKEKFWWHEKFQGAENLELGLTYCCTYKDFRKAVGYVPSLTVKGTYAMPKQPPLPRFRSVIKKVIKNNRRSKDEIKK